jgi:hypothetical protein
LLAKSEIRLESIYSTYIVLFDLNALKEQRQVGFALNPLPQQRQDLMREEVKKPMGPPKQTSIYGKKSVIVNKNINDDVLSRLCTILCRIIAVPTTGKFFDSFETYDAIEREEYELISDYYSIEEALLKGKFMFKLKLLALINHQLLVDLFQLLEPTKYKEKTCAIFILILERGYLSPMSFFKRLIDSCNPHIAM